MRTSFSLSWRRRRSDGKVGDPLLITLRALIYSHLGLYCFAASHSIDVVIYLKRIITYTTLTATSSSGPLLSIEERNLLSIAYKNITGSLRNSLRLIDTLEKREGATKQELALLKRQRDKVEKDLSAKCKDLLENVLEQLVPAAGKGEERVFYYKMFVFSLDFSLFAFFNIIYRQGDYYRYLSEFAKRNNALREHYASLSLTSYKASYKHALHTLEPWHPTRLGLALNFAVYFRDVKSDPERACHLAKFAFDEAVAGMLANRVGAGSGDGSKGAGQGKAGAGAGEERDEGGGDAGALSEKTFRDCVVILTLLRDDMLLWAAEMGVSAYVEQ